jgi:hypothetical protein
MFVLTGRGLCVGLITRPEESYRVIAKPRGEAMTRNQVERPEEKKKRNIKMDVRKTVLSSLLEELMTTTKQLIKQFSNDNSVGGRRHLASRQTSQQTLLSQSLHLLDAFRLSYQIIFHPLSCFLFVVVVKWFVEGTIKGYVYVVRQAKMMSLWSAIWSISIPFLCNHLCKSGRQPFRKRGSHLRQAQ